MLRDFYHSAGAYDGNIICAGKRFMSTVVLLEDTIGSREPYAMVSQGLCASVS